MDWAIWGLQAMASMVTTAPARLRPAARFSSNRGIAVVSLLLSSTASCPRTRPLRAAKADQLAEPTGSLATIRSASLDEDALAAQGYGHEHLDQLVTELLLGIR